MKILESADIGAAIRSRRKELHYTQAYISEFTGLSISFISDVENGKPTVELGKVLRLVQILGMDLFIEKR
ncbi:MAG: helix-turn-helix transcriptional regulator [Lachnospiraceae bacterium]|nr:helix-turn-helix transcriptional regulator [Lachnospiraceae bacterium]